MKAKQVQNATYTARVEALRALRARLVEKNGPDAGRDVDAMLKDNGKFAFTEKVNAYIDGLGLDAQALGAIFAPGANPKVSKRFVQFASAMHSGLVTAADRTTLWALAALLQGQTLQRDALHYLATGKVQSDGVSPETRGIARRKLEKVLGSVGHSAVETQLSRTLGKNGFLVQLGAVVKEGARNASLTMNTEHPLVTRFVEVIAQSTDDQLKQAMGIE